MAQDATAVILTSGVELATTLITRRALGYRCLASSNRFIELSFLRLSELLKTSLATAWGLSKRCKPPPTGRRHPKGKKRDLEKRVVLALRPGLQINWMKAHLTETAVTVQSIRAGLPPLISTATVKLTVADILANQGTDEHAPLDLETFTSV
eukprot:2723508-Amphidinium_carterae.1